MDGSVATADEVPVVLGVMPQAWVQVRGFDGFCWFSVFLYFFHHRFRLWPGFYCIGHSRQSGLISGGNVGQPVAAVAAAVHEASWSP